MFDTKFPVFNAKFIIFTHQRLTESLRVPRFAKIISRFSIENHHFSAALPHYLCVFYRGFETKLTFLFAIPTLQPSPADHRRRSPHLHFKCTFPRFRCQISRFKCRYPRFKCKVPRFKCKIPRFKCRYPRFKCRYPRFKCKIPRFKCTSPRFKCKIPRC